MIYVHALGIRLLLEFNPPNKKEAKSEASPRFAVQRTSSIGIKPSVFIPGKT